MLCECKGTGKCQKCQGDGIVGGLTCDKCDGSGKCICVRDKRNKRQGNGGWFSWTEEKK